MRTVWTLLILCVAGAVRAALLPPGFINAVVALGHNQPNPTGPPTWVTEASGFFYGYLVKDDPD
jgi:hypothetical protein